MAVPIVTDVNNDHWGGAGALVGSFGANEGPPGMVVHLLGSGLTGVTAVAFGGVPATAFTVLDDSTVEATVPNVALASTTATATNPDGTATGAYTVLFIGPWQTPPDANVVDTAAGDYISAASSYRIAQVADDGVTPDMFHGAYHPDAIELLALLTGDQIVGPGVSPYGAVAGQEIWVRQLGFAILNLVSFMATGPSAPEIAAAGYKGYLVESVDGFGGTLTSSLEMDYRLTVLALAYFDHSAKTAVAADNMTGDVELLRPPAADYDSTGRVLAPDAWPDPATIAAWPALVSQPLDTGMGFFVVDHSGDGGYIFDYMSNGAPIPDGTNNAVATGTVVVAAADLDASPAGSAYSVEEHPHTQVPLVFALSRFGDGVTLAPLASPPGGKSQRVGGAGSDTIDGSPESSFFADASLKLTEIRFSYTPARIRLLHADPVAPDLTASLSAATRPRVSLRAALHAPAAPSVPAPGAVVFIPAPIHDNDNYADAHLLLGASGSVVFDLTGFAEEGGEVFSAGHSAWFAWVATMTGTASFDTAATPPPRWDSMLSAYSDGVGLPDVGRLLDNEDNNLSQPAVFTPDGFGTDSVTFFCTAGDTYYIQVSSYDYPAAAPNPSAGYPRTDYVLRWVVF